MEFRDANLPAVYVPPLVDQLHGNEEPGEGERQGRKKTIKKVLIAIALMIVLVPLVTLYSIAVLARNPIVYVESASLNRFSLSDDGRFIRYNLTTVISVRNSNRLYATRYEGIEGDVLYSGERIATWKRLPPNLHQERKTTTLLRVEFAGESPIADPGSEVWKFFRSQEILGGDFGVQIAIRAGIGHDFGKMRLNVVSQKISCMLYALRIEASASTSATATTASPAPNAVLSPPFFSRTECIFED